MQSGLRFCSGLQIANDLIGNDRVVRPKPHYTCYPQSERHGTERLLPLVQVKEQITREQGPDAFMAPASAAHGLYDPWKVHLVALPLEIDNRQRFSRRFRMNQIPTQHGFRAAL
jgi:hypothetical protein